MVLLVLHTLGVALGVFGEPWASEGTRVGVQDCWGIITNRDTCLLIQIHFCGTVSRKTISVIAQSSLSNRMVRIVLARC